MLRSRKIFSWAGNWSVIGYRFDDFWLFNVVIEKLQTKLKVPNNLKFLNGQKECLTNKVKCQLEALQRFYQPFCIGGYFLKLKKSIEIFTRFFNTALMALSFHTLLGPSPPIYRFSYFSISCRNFFSLFLQCPK